MELFFYKGNENIIANTKGKVEDREPKEKS